LNEYYTKTKLKKRKMMEVKFIDRIKSELSNLGSLIYQQYSGKKKAIPKSIENSMIPSVQEFEAIMTKR
jgi:hypothetical protein